jgi:hypothetical protein
MARRGSWRAPHAELEGRDVSWRACLTFPERRPGRTLLAIGICFGLAYGSSLVVLPKAGGRVLLGDAVHYFVYLRSVVFDHDLHFRNEYVRMYGLTGDDPETDWVFESTPTGRVRNLMPIGPAILWAPAFLLTAGGLWLADLLGGQFVLDGYGRAFQASAGFSGVAAATLGCWLAFRAAAQLFDRRTAIWSVLAIWLASSAVYYSVISPAYSHAASMLVVSAAWLAWIASIERQTPGRYFHVGVMCGLAALMRWQDAALLVVPCIDAVWHRDDGMVRMAALIGMSVAGAALAFTPQAVAWYLLYGQPLAIPQGAAFMRWTEPALWQVLFSSNHGLLTWTPVVGLAVIGIGLGWRQSPLVATAALTFVAISWYVNASVADWWAGEAFGSRRFVSCLPMLVFGLAAMFHRFQARLPALVTVAALFTGHTLLLLIQYQAYMHGLRGAVEYPAENLLFGRFHAPLDVLSWWWRR